MSLSERAKTRRTLKRLLKRLRRRTPEFKRRLHNSLKKFERRDSWRKPKGNDNKMRLQLKGYPPIVKEGYRSARLIRGLHPSGLIPVVIANLKDAESLSPDKHVIYISSTVGLRKRVELERVLKERGFRIANERGVS